jgi:hypothetical protein
MCKRRDHLLVLSTTLVLLFIALVCEAQTIRSQRKLNLLDEMTGVITNIGDTRVTISFQETAETLTLHVRDASGLKVGDTVRMEGGRPVKIDLPVKMDVPVKPDTSAEPPKQASPQKVEESPPVVPAPQPQSGPSEASKSGSDAKK